MSQLSPDKYLSVLDDLLKKGKTVQVAVSGMSMFPMLMKGDVVLVKQESYEDLKKGDIVVFKIDVTSNNHIQNKTKKNTEIWVAHRLLKKNNGKLITQGDGNRVKDTVLSFNKVKGVVVKVTKSKWRLASLSTKWPGRALAYTSIVSGPALWLLGKAASKIYRMLKKNL